MRKVTLSEMDSRMGPADLILPLTDALGTTDVALNYYELDPGESTAYGYHVHSGQEEVFVPVEGELTFETGEGEVTVGEGELLRFGRGEYQRSRNATDDRVRVLVLGAPQEAGETEILRDCATCGGRTPHDLEMADDRSAILARCGECGDVTGRFT